MSSMGITRIGRPFLHNTLFKYARVEVALEVRGAPERPGLDESNCLRLGITPICY